jgi:hypothetical protein
MSYFQVAPRSPVNGWSDGRLRPGAGGFHGWLGQPSPDEIKNEQDLVWLLLPLCLDKILPRIKQLVPEFEVCLTDIMFGRRHPDLRRKKLPARSSATAAEKALLNEKDGILKDVVRPVVENYVKGLLFELKRKRDDGCKPLTLQDLNNFLVFLQNPQKKKLDGTLEPAPTEDVNRVRRFVEREARTLGVLAEAYGELGCPVSQVKALKEQVERLPWPADQAMQAARNQLLGALQRSLNRLGAK